MTKKILHHVARLLLGSLLLLSSPSYATANPVSDTSFLFIQNAKTGILQRDNTQPAHYKFILKDISPYVIYFSDRPQRISGLMSPEKFMQLWQKKAAAKDNFAVAAPNVAVNGIQVHHVLDKQDRSFVMVLSAPVYDQSQRSIVYDAHFLRNDHAGPHLAGTTLHDVVLFFDDILDPCTDSQCCPTC